MPQHNSSAIRYVGTDQLPVIAAKLLHAHATLRQQAAQGGSSFRSSELSIDVPLTDEAIVIPELYAEGSAGWAASTATFVAILQESAQRVADAARAMIQIADNYEAAEAHGAEILRGLEHRVENLRIGGTHG